MKKTLLSLIGLCVVIACLVLAYAFYPTTTRAIAAAPNTDDPAVIERGRYVATASDCVACHTSAKGKPFAGGLSFHTPIGTVFSTNITPDKQDGIGTYTLADFDRAVRHGIRKDGASMYPAMPFPSYASLTDQDVSDMYAFFMKSVEPVKQANLASDIPFPMSMRWPLAIWRKTFAPDPDRDAFDPKKYKDDVTARGAYLVQAAGHCGACHTPRTVALSEKTLSDADPSFLSGGQIIDGFFAVNIRTNKAEGIGNWSKEDIVATLSSGRNPHFSVVGSPMNDAVAHSLQYLTTDDQNAIATYLKTLAPSPGEKATYTPVKETVFDKTGRGAEIYADSCSACHLSGGQGTINAVPALAGNPTVLAPDSATTIRVVLEGAMLSSTEKRPSNLGMPGFANRYSDEEIAQLVTFMRSTWGNGAAAVSAKDVAAVRSAVKTEKVASSH